MSTHPTFSITASPDSWPGVIRAMSKEMDVKTTGAFRHSFEALELVVHTTVGEMNAARVEMFDEIVKIHAAQPCVITAGDFESRRAGLVASLHMMGRRDFAVFVDDLTWTQFVVLVELARWRRAFGDRAYGVAQTATPNQRIYLD